MTTLVNVFRSDIAYWAGLLVIWELVVILLAVWAVPDVLAAASTAGAVPPANAAIGAGV